MVQVWEPRRMAEVLVKRGAERMEKARPDRPKLRLRVEAPRPDRIATPFLPATANKFWQPYRSIRAIHRWPDVWVSRETCGSDSVSAPTVPSPVRQWWNPAVPTLLTVPPSMQ